MIEREGFKAFHGTMRITPNSTDKQPVDITTDWLYKPEYNCWYGDGCSFDADICAVVEDQSVEKTADEMFEELGFTKNTSLCYESKSQALYEKSVMNGTDTFQVYFNGGDVTYWDDAGHAVWMQKELIEAILKKMEEMGW